MTDQPGQPIQLPPVDPASAQVPGLLNPRIPSLLTVGTQQLPDGQPVVLLGLRSGNTTLTVFLPPAQAAAWANQIKAAAAGAPQLVIAPAGAIPPAPPAFTRR